MKQIKLLKDWQSKKKGDIINISEKGAESAIRAGVAEYLDVKKENIKGTRKWVAENYFKDAKYNEEENVIEIGEKEEIERVIHSYLTKQDLAEQLWKIKPYFYDNTRIWWLWDNEKKYWKIVDDKDILIMVSKSSPANTINSKEKNEILEALQQYGRQKIPQKIKSTWIQFHDEIVDIETGKTFKATPKYFVTNPIPWRLHPEKFEETPVMDKIFKEWVGKNYVQTLYEILAYCVLPDYPINRTFCLIGSGMNGKTKFLELLRKFIGEQNVCSTELDTLLTSRFEVTRLHKKLCCQMGETNFNELKKTSMLKKLSGGDLIGFEYKRKDPFEEENYAKIIIATNNLPATSDKTIGFYRRWLIIDFPTQFSESKDILKEIPDEEYNSLALKSIIILKDLLEKRKFHNEGSINERIKKYEDYSNPFEKFFKEYVDEDIDSYIWKHDFEKKLNEWCKENRFREISEVAIGKKMKQKGIDQKLKQATWLTDGISKRYRAWIGIKWKENGNNHKI